MALLFECLKLLGLAMVLGSSLALAIGFVRAQHAPQMRCRRRGR